MVSLKVPPSTLSVTACPRSRRTRITSNEWRKVAQGRSTVPSPVASFPEGDTWKVAVAGGRGAGAGTGAQVFRHPGYEGQPIVGVPLPEKKTNSVRRLGGWFPGASTWCSPHPRNAGEVERSGTGEEGEERSTRKYAAKSVARRPSPAEVSARCASMSAWVAVAPVRVSMVAKVSRPQGVAPPSTRSAR
jgi:hypothetical protein